MMKTYLAIFRVYFRQSLAKLLIFRTSGMISILYSLIYLIGSYLSIKVYFSNATSLAGWSEGEMLLLMGSFQLMAGIFDVFFLWAQDSVPTDIMEGNLDIHLLRPANPLFMICTRDLYIPGLVNLPVPLLMIWIGLEKAGIEPSFLEWGFFSLFILMGSFLMFCLTQLVLNLSFWIEGYSGIWAVADELIKLGSRPLGMYVPGLRLVFGFLFPVVTALNLPTDVLRKAATFEGVGLSIALVVFLFVLMKLQFQRGLRRYQSASS